MTAIDQLEFLLFGIHQAYIYHMYFYRMLNFTAPVFYLILLLLYFTFSYSILLWLAVSRMIPYVIGDCNERRFSGKFLLFVLVVSIEPTQKHWSLYAYFFAILDLGI